MATIVGLSAAQAPASLAPPVTAKHGNNSAIPEAQPGRAAGGDHVPDGLSTSDWSSIRAAYETRRLAAFAVDDGYQTRNPGQRWRTRFDGRGFLTTPDAGGWSWGLELLRYGRAGAEQPVTAPSRVEADGGRVSYPWDDGLTEWYVNDRRGLEHGYTIQRRPIGSESGRSLTVAARSDAHEGKGHKLTGETPVPHTRGTRILPLQLTLAVRGDLRPRVSAGGRNVTFVNGAGAAVVNYHGLLVLDAGGAVLPAWFEASSEALALVLSVDDRGARYPLTIDPVAQQAYLKASNTDSDDEFGFSVAVSGDTVVVGAFFEDSNATGVDGNQADNSAGDSGAAYVFVKGAGGVWSQQAYLKASNTDSFDRFGVSVAVSGDTVVVGAFLEDSNATDVDGNGADNSAGFAGAAYVFVRDAGGVWSQQAYLKASNTDGIDRFGFSVAVSGDTVVVGADGESSSATGVDGNQADNSADFAGAAYVFVAGAGGVWSQQAYLKASNTDSGDGFGQSVAIWGDTVVVGAGKESSSATGVDGNQADNSADFAGAAYVFVRDAGGTWSQQAYLKASNPDIGDFFGDADSVTVSGDTVVVGAFGESSSATGTGGNQADNSARGSGAAYVFVRDAGGVWSQQAYLKASNTDSGDLFGGSVAVSGDTVVVGAFGESSSAAGTGGNQADNSATGAGAAYVFFRDAGGVWSQQAYLKASNTDGSDRFGRSVAVSGDTVVVGANQESSSATGTGGNQADDSAIGAGAAYVFVLPQVCNNNGILDPGEACDDANATNGDGCSATCMIELGFSCTGEPSICVQDCNGNGIADATDIDNATSQDCNGNGIPDECEIDANSIAPGGPFFCMSNCAPDCNANGVPDACDITSGTSQDCNDNKVPDECEIDAASGAPGGPFFCMANCDPDCNANGIPDACDIADCLLGDVTCDDCNLNGVPDSCDIAAMTSADANSDGVPDECVASTGGGGTVNWSDGGNWPLGGVDFPDNNPANPNGAPNLNVTIGGGAIFLDTSVEVNSTRVLSSGVLSITQPGTGDLAIAGAGGLSTTGILEVANDRTITVGGTFTVGGAGRYDAATGAGGTGCPGGIVCASLTARSVRVQPGDCATATFGGSLILSEGMALTTTGGLTVIGSATPDCTGPLGFVADTQGITPPPKFVVRDFATVMTSGSLVMSGAVGSFVDSTQPIILLGDFDNDVRFPGLESSSFPTRFDWSQASVRMEGTQPQRFEVAGLDFGPTPGGFLTDADTLFETVTHTNFSIGALTVADGSAARFVNDRINSAGAGPCEEALYVGQLELEGAATIVLDNVRVFYNDFVGDPAAVRTIGCGALRGVCKAAPASAETILDGGGVTVASVKDRFLSFSGGDPGLSQAVRVTFVSLPGAFSVFNATVAWVDMPVAASELPGKGLTDPVGTDPSFMAAALSNVPVFADWSTFGVVHVYDERIIPSRRLPGQSLEPAVYDIQLVTDGCDISTETSFSPPLTITNARWGDLAQLAAGEFRAPDGVVAIDDTLALLAKFAGSAGAPIKARTELVGVGANGPDGAIDGKITVSDLLAVLDAFAGGSYPFAPPTS